jgi:two-component system NtrC family sensor kinase
VGKTGEAYLINKDGLFQTKQRSGGKLMETDPDFSASDLPNGRIVTYTDSDHQGNKFRYAIGRLHQTDWQLVVRQDFMDAASPLIQAVMVAIGLIFIGGAVVVVIAFFLASNVAYRLSLADAEKREMTNQLIMAGKLAEVGEMSSGIAHEINNPLQVMKAEVTMIGDLFQDLRPQNDADKENFDLIKDSVNQIGIQIDRCRKITQGLLKFARKSDPVIRKIVPGELITETVDMVAHQAMLDQVVIQTNIARGMPEIESDPSQLQQVLLNLINNAVYAVKDAQHPEVGITADQENDRLRIRVMDNGCGIAEDQLEKIFLPFFTTKPVGSGTGLGLSTSFGIIENLGGKIEVESKVGVGTTFTVLLPAS